MLFYLFLCLIPIIGLTILYVLIGMKRTKSSLPQPSPQPSPQHLQIPIPLDNSVGVCGRCTNSSQCKTTDSTDPNDPVFCCPYMRLCVNEHQSCQSNLIADCNPRCFDQYDQTKCQCKNSDFPYNWIN